MSEKKLQVITISREFGSGGHSIAVKLAEELQIPFYDRQIVEKAAEESGYSQTYVENEGEYMKPGEHFLERVLLSNSPGFSDPQDEVFLIQKKIILKLSQSSCIIIGRCADFLLKQAGFPVFSVFIHANDDFRAKRVLERYGATDVCIEKRLHSRDEERKRYYHHYTRQEWGACKNYHITLDAGFLGEDTCVEILKRITDHSF